MTPLRATAAITAMRLCARTSAAALGAAAGGGVSSTRASNRKRRTEQIIAAPRVLPAFLPQVHPVGIPADQPAAAVCAGGADRQPRSSGDAEPAGGAAGGASRPSQPPALRAGDDV